LREVNQNHQNTKENKTMKAIDVVRNALQISDSAMMQLIEDMSDAPLTQPTPRGGNHPLWILGHITFIEGNVPHVLFGEPNPVARWAPLFAPGTEPTADASAYPPFDELVHTYRDLRARNLQILEQLGEAGLDRPTKSPPRGLEHVLGTVGQSFLTIALHQMSHRGQVADARRVAGRKPVFTPGFD
jgi:uncharacterized damage-inducible protein DinB